MKRLLLAAACTLALCTQAQAWATEGGPTIPTPVTSSSTPVKARATATATSTGSPVVNNISVAPAAAPQQRASRGDGQRPSGPSGRSARSGSGRSGGSSGGTVVDSGAPVIVAPSMSSADNCAVGIVLGGVGQKGGGTLGFLWEDDGCARARNARVEADLGDRDVARDMMCVDPIVRWARRARQRPCPQDRAEWIRAGWTVKQLDDQDRSR